MSKRWATVVVIVAVANFFCASEVALSEPGLSTNESVALRVSDIVIPPELGYVVETHQPASGASFPLLVYIQEAHANYEAQRGLVAILEQLVQQFRLKLILVEGGHGDLSLARLRSFSQLDSRKQLAEKYLKIGLMSGEEYLDLTAQDPLILWGIEEQDLYRQNVEAFIEAERALNIVKPLLGSVRQAIEALRPKLLGRAFNELEIKTLAFNRGEMGVADYAELIARMAGPEIMKEPAYAELSSFLEGRALERALDRDRIEQEQSALLAALSRQVSAAQLDELTTKARQVKSGALSRQSFYSRLEALAALSGTELSLYPRLSSYIRYVKVSAQLRSAALAGELEQLLLRLRQERATTAPARQLQAIAEQFDLIEKGFNLELAPQEYQRLHALDLSGKLSGWADVLNEQLIQHGVPGRMVERLDGLEAALPVLSRFYETARARDVALAGNALAKLRRTNDPIAVLITGGFHAPRLARALNEEGVGIVVVAPKISRVGDRGHYSAVLRYKSGYGHLEDVQVAPSQTTRDN